MLYFRWKCCSKIYEVDEIPDNLFTYRGYYYDQDLGLYYLQTRYYDPSGEDAESKRKPPMDDELNTDRHLRDEKGIKQTRHYGPDGRAEYDIDYRHTGPKHKFPHKHKWTWNGNSWERSDPIDIF